MCVAVWIFLSGDQWISSAISDFHELSDPSNPKYFASQNISPMQHNAEGDLPSSGKRHDHLNRKKQDDLSNASGFHREHPTEPIPLSTADPPICPSHVRSAARFSCQRSTPAWAVSQSSLLVHAISWCPRIFSELIGGPGHLAWHDKPCQPTMFFMVLDG